MPKMGNHFFKKEGFGGERVEEEKRRKERERREKKRRKGEGRKCRRGKEKEIIQKKFNCFMYHHHKNSM